MPKLLVMDELPATGGNSRLARTEQTTR